MKFILLISMTLTSMAFSQFSFKPNTYNCMNKEKNILINYSTSSLRGLPLFTYTEVTGSPTDSRISSEGDKILSQQTFMGKIVYIEETNEDKKQPITSYGLIIPSVTMADPHGAVRFNTHAIISYISKPSDGTYRSEDVQEQNHIFAVSCFGLRVIF